MTSQRLSPLDALLEAGVRIRQRREALLRSCGLALAATLLTTGAGSLLVGLAQFALQLTSVVLLALCAALVQRVLAPLDSPAAPLGLWATLRLWLRYLLWLLVLLVLLVLSVTEPVNRVMDVASGGKAPGDPLPSLQLALALGLVVLGLYLSARLCLVLPAVALQHGAALRQAWSRSRGNGSALVVLLLLPERLQWLIARAAGTSPAARLATALLEVLLLLGIAALLSAAWSRSSEPAQPIRGPLPASWATALLALPVVVSHGWSQAETHYHLLDVRGETALMLLSEAATRRQHEASRAVLDGDRSRALRLYREALELHRAAGNASGEAWTLAHIGAAERELGNEPAARAAMQSALESARAAGETNVEALVREALAKPPPSP